MPTQCSVVGNCSARHCRPASGNQLEISSEVFTAVVATLLSSRLPDCVASWADTDVSEDYTAFFFKAKVYRFINVSTFKIEAACSYETSVCALETKRFHNPREYAEPGNMAN
jgi:hypothetical protein